MSEKGWKKVNCPRCGGSGKDGSRACPRCDGYGYIVILEEGDKK